jgi:hypothetical protein
MVVHVRGAGSWWCSVEMSVVYNMSKSLLLAVPLSVANISSVSALTRIVALVANKMWDPAAMIPMWSSSGWLFRRMASFFSIFFHCLHMVLLSYESWHASSLKIPARLWLIVDHRASNGIKDVAEVVSAHLRVSFTAHCGYYLGSIEVKCTTIQSSNEVKCTALQSSNKVSMKSHVEGNFDGVLMVYSSTGQFMVFMCTGRFVQSYFMVSRILWSVVYSEYCTACRNKDYYSTTVHITCAGRVYPLSSYPLWS